MSKISILDAEVKYSARDSAVAFVSEDGKPFKSAVVGVTYPHAGYRIERGREVHFTVLEYVVEGEGELNIEGRQVRVRAGDTYILRAGESHTYYSDRAKPWKKLWINYDAEYILPMLDAFGLTSDVYSGRR